VVAVTLAVLFFAAGGQALLLAIAVILAAVLARIALRSRGGSLALGVLTLVFALIAGVQMAKGLAGGSGNWLTGIEAIAAAMLCGSLVALKWLNRRTVREADIRRREQEPDCTVEMEVRTAPARPVPISLADREPPSWRPAIGLVAAGLLGFAVLLTVPPRADERAGVADSVAGASTEETFAGQHDARAAADARGGEPDAQPVSAPASLAGAPGAALSTKLVTRTVTPSHARRECLAQVESAHLFMNIARTSSSASLYTRLTNTEIKRIAAGRPVKPYTLQHIAQGMWERRHEPDRGAAWWSQQYARCEESRIDGGSYVVRG
jgi:hypothetical protein